MPTYRYESKTQQGKVVSGVLNAASLSAASEQIRARGEYIISLSGTEAAVIALMLAEQAP